MTPIQPEDVFNLTLTGSDLQVLVSALGEIPHKLAKPVENTLIHQIEAAQAAKQNV